MNSGQDHADFGSMLAGRYELVRLIGRGGMGSVYEARHAVTRRHVAVKLMHPGDRWTAASVERFVREARVAAAVVHPNIVEVLDAGSIDGLPHIVFALLKGESLGDRIARDGTVPLRDALAIIADVLEALAAAHARGVVHRDIKPENIFLSTEPDGRRVVKLLDFGISKVIEGAEADLVSRTLTRTGSVLGTVDYMSPEQLRGDDVDGRADLWSVGITLYRMLAGQLPFRGKNSNLVVLAIMIGSAEPLHVVAPGTPRAVSDIVARLLSNARDERQPDAQSVLAELRAILATPDSELHSIAAAVVADTIAEAGAIAPGRVEIANASHGRMRSRLGLAMTGAAVLALGFAAVQWRAHRPVMSPSRNVPSTAPLTATREPVPVPAALHAHPLTLPLDSQPIVVAPAIAIGRARAAPPAAITPVAASARTSVIGRQRAAAIGVSTTSPRQPGATHAVPARPPEAAVQGAPVQSPAMAVQPDINGV